MTLSTFVQDLVRRDTTVTVLSAYNGKTLAKAYREVKHGELFGTRQVVGVWAEILVVSREYAKPIVCVYVDGHEEWLKNQESKEEGK